MAIKIPSKLEHLTPGEKIADAVNINYDGPIAESGKITDVSAALDNIYGRLNAEPTIVLYDTEGNPTNINRFDFDMGAIPEILFRYDSTSSSPAQILVSDGTTTYLSGRRERGELIRVQLPVVRFAGQSLYTITVTDLDNGKTASATVTHIYGGIQLVSNDFSQNLSRLTFVDNTEVILNLEYTLSYYENDTFGYFLQLVISDDSGVRFDTRITDEGNTYFEICQTATGQLSIPITLSKLEGVDYESLNLELRAILDFGDGVLKHSSALSDNIILLPSEWSIITDIISLSGSISDDKLDTDDSISVKARLFTNVPALGSIDGLSLPLELRYRITGDNTYSSANLEGVPTFRGNILNIDLGRLPAGNYTMTFSGHSSDNDDTGITNIPENVINFEILQADDRTTQYVKNRNLIAYFNSEGKTNTENRNYWYAENNPNYYFKLTGFSYNESASGWAKADDDNTVALKFNSSTYAAMYERVAGVERTFNPMRLFDSNSTNSGQTLEILFKSECIGQLKTNVLSCINENDSSCAGYYVKYDRVTAINRHSSGASRQISEGQWTHVTFVFDNVERALDKPSSNADYADVTVDKIENANPYATARVYIDGCLSSIEKLNNWEFKVSTSSSDNAAQLLLNAALDSTGQPNYFGSCEIKMIRLYGAPLTSEEVLKNYISTIRDKETRHSVNDRNIVSTSPIPVIRFVANKQAYLHKKSSKRFKGWESANNGTFELLHRIKSKKEQKDEDGNILDGGRTSKNYFVNCTMWYTYYNGSAYVTDVYRDVDVYLQGTSSLTYPVKNYQIKLYDTSTAYYDSDLGRWIHGDELEFNPPNVSISDGWYQETASNVYTLKCDYMEQSHRNNTPTAIFYENLMDKIRSDVVPTYRDDDKYSPPSQITQTITRTDPSTGESITYANQRVYRDAINGFGSLVYYNENPNVDATKSGVSEFIQSSTTTLTNTWIIRDTIIAASNLDDVSTYYSVSYRDNIATISLSTGINLKIDLFNGTIIENNLSDGQVIQIKYHYYVDCNRSSSLTSNVYAGYDYDCFAGSFMFNVDKEGRQLGFDLGLGDGVTENITYPKIDPATGMFARDSEGKIEYVTAMYNGRPITRDMMPCVSLEGTSNTSGASAGAFYSYSSYVKSLESAGKDNPFTSESEYLAATLDPRFTYIENFADSFGGEDSSAYKDIYDKVVYNQLRGTIAWLENVISDDSYNIDVSDITKETVNYSEIVTLEFNTLNTEATIKRTDTGEIKTVLLSDYDDSESFINAANDLYNLTVDSYIEDLRESTYNYKLNEAKKSRFRSEFGDYFSYTYCLAYYLQMMTFTQIDNAGKNTMWDSWGGKLYPRPYDMDTQMGLDNSGKDDVIVVSAELSYLQDSTGETGPYTRVADCKSTYNTSKGAYDESKSLPRFTTGTAYNTTDSNLWTAFSKYFSQEIATAYSTLRSTVYTVDGICDFVDSLTKNVIGETFYNKDAVSKYINTIDIGNYLFACQGNRSSRYRHWLGQRFTFLDSKFECDLRSSKYTDITCRSNIPEGQPYFTADIVLNVYSPQYVKFFIQETQTYTYYIDPNSKYLDNDGVVQDGALISLPISGSNANYFIRGAGNIREIRHMEKMNLTFIDLSEATRLTNISINDSPALTEIAIGTNSYLQSINLSGCNGFSTGKRALQAQNCVNISSIDISNTNLTSVNIASGSPLSYLNIMNSQLGSLTLSNLAKLADDSKSLIICDRGTKAGAPPITSITIENCPLISDIPYGLDKQLVQIRINNMPGLTSFTRTANFETLIIENCDNLVSLNLSNSNLSNLKSPSASGDSSETGLLKLSTIPSLEVLNLSSTSSTIPITVQLSNSYNLKSLNISNSSIADIRVGSVPHTHPCVDLTGFKLNYFTARSNNQIIEVRNLTLIPKSDNVDFTGPALVISDSSHPTGYVPHASANITNYTTDLSSAFYDCNNLEAVSGNVKNCINFSNIFMYSEKFRALSYKLVDVTDSYPNGIMPVSSGADYKLKLAYSDDFDHYIKYRDYEYDNNGSSLFTVTLNSAFFGLQIDTDPSTSVVYGYGIDTAQVDVLSTQCPYTTNASGFVRSCARVTSAPNISNWYRLNTAWMFAASSGITSIPSSYFDAASNSLVKLDKAFYNCTSLKSVNSNIFKNLKKLSSTVDMFADSALTTLFGTNYDIMPSPTIELDDGSLTNNLIDISGMFRGCSNLIDATGDDRDLMLFFKDCRKLKYADFTFRNFANLSNIPDGILQYNTELNSVVGLFSRCDSVRAVPKWLFSNPDNYSSDDEIIITHPSLTRAGGLFDGCYSLGTSTDPSKNIVRRSLLRGAENLVSIGFDMGHYTTSDGSSRPQVSGMFSRTPIRGYEIGLFNNFTKLRDVSYLFSVGYVSNYANSTTKTYVTIDKSSHEQGLSEKPLICEAPFSPYVVNSDDTVRRLCDSSKNQIDVDLFKTLSDLVYADGVFAGRRSIQSLCKYDADSDTLSTCTIYTLTDDGSEKNGYVNDEDGRPLFEIDLDNAPTLFSNENNPSLISVDNLFRDCVGFVMDYYQVLFRLNSNIEYARQVFRGCSNISGRLDENMFINSKLKYIDGLFYGCTLLGSKDTAVRVSVPNKLFQPIKSTLTSATYVFYDCGLAGQIGTGSNEITEGNNRTNIGLLSGCNQLTNTRGLFMNCKRLKGAIPQDIFYEPTATTYDETLTDISEMFYCCYGLGTNYGVTPNAPSVRGGNPRTVYGQRSTSVGITSNKFEDYLIPDNWLGRRAGITNIRGLFSGVHSNNTYWYNSVYPETDTNKSIYPIIRDGVTNYTYTSGDNLLSITNNSINTFIGEVGIVDASYTFSHNSALTGNLNYDFLQYSHGTLSKASAIFARCTNLSSVGSGSGDTKNTVFAPSGATVNNVLVDLTGAFYYCSSLSGTGPDYRNLLTSCVTNYMTQGTPAAIQNQYTDVQNTGGMTNPGNFNQSNQTISITSTVNGEMQPISYSN